MTHTLGVSHAKNELPDRNGHTERDAAHLIAALGVDGPMSTQPRERERTCSHAGCRNKTFHQAGGCECHYIVPVAARRAMSEVAA